MSLEAGRQDDDAAGFGQRLLTRDVLNQLRDVTVAHLPCHGDLDAGRQPDLRGPDGEAIHVKVKRLRRHYAFDHERESVSDAALDLVQQIAARTSTMRWIDITDESLLDVERIPISDEHCLVVSTYSLKLVNAERLPRRRELSALLHVRVVSPVEELTERAEKLSYLKRAVMSLQILKAMLRSRRARSEMSASRADHPPGRLVTSSGHVTRGPNSPLMTAKPSISSGESFAYA